MVCRLLHVIVEAAKAVSDSLKDTQGVTLPIKHVHIHMSHLSHCRMSAVTGGCD